MKKAHFLTAILFMSLVFASSGVALSCSDGTSYGNCSTTKPLHCNYSGILVNRCDICGCPSGQTCNVSSQACQTPSFDFILTAMPPSGTVIQSYESIVVGINATLTSGSTNSIQLSVTGCPANTTCTLKPTVGLPTFSSLLRINTTSSTPVGVWSINVSGSNGVIIRRTNYILTVNPSCTCSSWVNGACGAGGCASNQRQQTRTCTPSGCLAESQCVADSTCLPSCSDGTLYGSCSVTKPLFCLSGSLISNCTICGCNSGYKCQLDGTCKSIGGGGGGCGRSCLMYAVGPYLLNIEPISFVSFIVLVVIEIIVLVTIIKKIHVFSKKK